MGKITEDILKIKAVVASVSGVLHNNQDIIGTLDGKPFKGWLRSHYDGQGVSLLRAIGIHVCFVKVDSSDQNDPIEQMIERWNELPSSMVPSVRSGWAHVRLIGGVIGQEQIAPVELWLGSYGHTFADCAVMGHDLVQVPLMREAQKNGAFLIAPAQAEDVVKEISDHVTFRAGGNGAFRDFANLVIKVRGIDPTTLPTR